MLRQLYEKFFDIVDWTFSAFVLPLAIMQAVVLPHGNLIRSGSRCIKSHLDVQNRSYVLIIIPLSSSILNTQ